MQEFLLDWTSTGPAHGLSERKMHAKQNHQGICAHQKQKWKGY